MKRHLFIALVIIFSGIVVASADTKPSIDPTTSLLNDALKPTYHDVVGGKPEETIVGRPLDLSLSLRFCSAKHILFEDTKVVLDKETKYYFVKWKFDPATVQPILGKKNVRCRVKGKVVEVRRGETTPNMPHIIVRLESIVLQQIGAR